MYKYYKESLKEKKQKQRTNGRTDGRHNHQIPAIK